MNATPIHNPARHPKVWFVTGASSGLGRAIVESALRAGDIVVGTVRKPDALESLQREWPSTLDVHQLDVTDPEAARNVVAAVTRERGRIDVLVNNAGRAQIGAIEETSDSDLRALFDLHVFAPMNLVRLVLPGMREQRRGLIIQMSSMGSVLIKPGFGAYSATKAALDGLSATLAAEVGQFGVEVMIVQPGSHKTSVFAPESRYMVPPMAEYGDVLSEVRDFVGRSDGHQPGDPDLAADVIVEVVDSPVRPLRLALGADAVQLISAGLADMSKELLDWAPTSQRTAAADGPSAEEIALRHESTRARSV